MIVNRMKNRKIIQPLALMLAVLIILVFVTGVLDRQKTWAEMVWSGLDFPAGTSRDLSAGDAYGVINGGPGLTLPAGRYRVKWMIEADGANSIEITTDNGAAALPARIATSADLVTDEHVFELKETAENVQLRVHFESGTRINVIDMRLYSPMYRDHAFTFAFLLLGVWFLYALHLSGALTPDRRGRLLLIGFAVLLASAPALKDTVCFGHDTTFHLMRLCNLADGLAHGQLPARIGGYSYNGYGAITSVFYPDLFLYIPALMMNLGASLQYAVNVFFIAVNAASAAAMYAAAKRIFCDEDTALCASILYTLSIYRITDMFSRYAFGEMTAMVFLPLFILGLWEVVFGEKRSWMTLALSAWAIFMSHMLSTLICACTAVGVGVLFIVKIVREGRLVPILKACAAAGLLCAFYLVPFVMYSMQGIGAQELAKDPALYAISPAQLLLLGSGEMPIDPLDWSLSSFSIEIGFPLLLGTVVLLYYVVTVEKKEKDRQMALLLCAAGLAFALMSTTLFPWGHVQLITRGLSDYLQFPWRMLMMTAVLLSLAAAWGYMRFSGKNKEKMIVFVLTLCAMAALPTISTETRNNNYIPFGETIGQYLSYMEYTIPGTRSAPTKNRSVIVSGQAEVTQYSKESTTIHAQVRAQGDAEISFPIFGYDGYVVTLGGQEMDWYCGENNRLTLQVPAGASGELEIWFASKAIWRVADGISLMTAAALIWMACKKRKELQQ